jgi:integrase
VASRNRPTPANPARAHRKPRSSRLGAMEFYRVLDMLPTRWRCYFITLTLTGLRLEELRELQPEDLDHEARAIRLKSETGSRTIYVAEEFWHWAMASVPVPVTQSHVRDLWDAAVERSGLKGVSLSDLRRLRSKFLAEARGRTGLRLVRDQAREEARLLVEVLPVLALTEDEARRLLLPVCCPVAVSRSSRCGSLRAQVILCTVGVQRRG